MEQPRQSSSEPGPPQPFGKYLLDAELAEGGMARVFRARLRGPGGFEKRLVVKQILPQLAQDPDFIELFVREANTLVQMSHPNVVPIYELGVVDGVYFLAMELVEGANVQELLRDGPLPQALVAHIGAQVCDALRYAHERFGLIHRDVTPRNVMADADGHVRLLDFGIAAPAARTGRGELFGSPGYMSGEQMRGEPLTARSDLFSLGSVLYEALTARPALQSPALAAAQLAAEDAVSPELAELIHALLAVDPAERPGSAAEVAAQLRTWLAQKHPEGVARALAQRVEQARHRAERPRGATPLRIDSKPPPGNTPQLTRSIATSKSLAQMLSGSSTEALPRAAVRRKRRTRTTGFALLAGLALAAGGFLVARGAEDEHAPPPNTRSESSARSKPASRSPAPISAPAKVAHPAPPPDQPRPTPQPPRDPAAARARLSINALPWADLRLDGRPLGTTPKRALPVSPGTHVLQLDCPPLRKQARVPLKLAPGDHRQLLVDLNTDPPTVTTR